MESLVRQIPEELLHRPHQPLTKQEAQEQLDSMLALVEQVLATDNQQGESSEQFDLDPRPGHILLRNNAPGQNTYHNLEEAEAHFRGSRQEGFLECKFRRFGAQGSLVRAETLRAQSSSTHVELLRRVWKLDFGERLTFYHIDLNRLDLSYSQNINE